MKKYFIILLSILSLAACTDNKRKANIDDIDINIKIGRFDQAFWNIDTLNTSEGARNLTETFPEMSAIYLQNVIRFGHPDSAITWDTYRLFRRDTAVNRLYNDALAKYTDVKDIEDKLSLAFRRGKYFFPDIATPNIYMHVSGLNQSIVVGSDFLSLSIDNYMGEDYPIYDKIGIYKYQVANMRPEKIVPDFITAWISSEYTINKTDRTLLDEIIYRGKIMYALSILLPDEKEEILMGYTKEQWEWSEEFEPQMWATLVSNRELFSRDPIKNSGYLNDGPFTIHFTQDSPGRGGVFVGWRIVESFMRKNPDVTPLELMQKTPDFILQKSAYNPK